MELDLAWYDVISNIEIASYIVAFLFFAGSSYLLISWGANLVAAIFLLLLGGVSFLVFSAGVDGLNDIQALNKQVLNIYKDSEKFPLFPREEAVFVFNALSESSNERFGNDTIHYSDILESNEAKKLTHFRFMSIDQLTVFSKYIEHCYSPELVTNIWNVQLSGYPIRSSDAQKAIEYAEARTNVVNPECLTSVAALFFLR